MASVLVVVGALARDGTHSVQSPDAGRPTSKGTAVAALDEAIASNRDRWGEASLRQPDGPSYEFFDPPAAAAALRGRAVPALPDHA
jgi:hypothetical protein